jgi:hypothetical protein
MGFTCEVDVHLDKRGVSTSRKDIDKSIYISNSTPERFPILQEKNRSAQLSDEEESQSMWMGGLFFFFVWFVSYLEGGAL